MYLRNRHKTSDYKNYQREIYEDLRGVDWPFEDEPVSFHIEAGFSTRAADIDNVLKPLLDTFQNIYDNFNDNKVYYVEAQKAIVPKGQEYLWIRVNRYVDGLLHRETTASEVPGLEEDEINRSK